MRTRTLSLLIVLSLLAALFPGCAPASPEHPANEASLTPATALASPTGSVLDGVVVGASLPLSGNRAVFGVAMFERLLSEVDARVVEFITTDSQSDPDTQITGLHWLLSSGVDMLIVAPEDETDIVPTLELCVEMGVPVVLIDRPVSYLHPSITYVGPDHAWEGRVLAELLAGASELNSVVELLPDARLETSTLRRSDAFEIACSAGGAEILAQGVWVDSDDSATEQMIQFLQVLAADAPVGVFAHNFQIAWDASHVLRAAGQRPDSDVPLVCAAGWLESMSAISGVMDGDLYAATLPSPYLAASVFQVLEAYQTGEPTTDRVVVEGILVTADNAQSVYDLYWSTGFEFFY